MDSNNIKKSLLFSIFCLAFFGSTHAQDIIIKRNGDEIKSKVREVNAYQIIFNYFDSINGPLYMIEKSEVFMIKYANGVNNTISYENTAPKALGKIEIKDGNYYQNGIEISYAQLIRKVNELGNQEAIAEINQAKFGIRYRTVLCWPSAVLLEASAIAIIGGISQANETSTYSVNGPSVSESNYNEGVTIASIGAITFVASSLGLIKSYAFHRSAKAHFKRAIEIYNKTLFP